MRCLIFSTATKRSSTSFTECRRHFLQTRSSFDKAVRLLHEYCEKEFHTKANLSNLDHIDIGYTTDEVTDIDIQVYADLETYRIVVEYGGKTAREELFADLDEMNIALENLDFEELVSLSDEEKRLSGVMTDKEQFFSECDLAKLLSKTSLAWDEIESLGFIFFDEGYIDRHIPNEKGHFGNGTVVDEAKAFELARRYQSGEDISKELTEGLFLYGDSSIPETRIPFENKFLEYLEVGITPTDNGYSVQYHHLSREITFEEIAVDRAYTKQGEEKQVDFINVVAWRNSAEFLCKYFSKGQRIGVVGSVRTGSYMDENGIKRYTFEVYADRLEFVERKDNGSSSSAQDEEYIPHDEDLPFN